MFDLTIWFSGLAAVLIVALLGWLASVPLRDVTLVDSLWALMFLLLASVYAVLDGTAEPRTMLVLVLVGIWALRLSGYLTWRNYGKDEDARYAKMRENRSGFAWKSLYIVFGLQAVLAWIISLPLLAATLSSQPLGWLDYAGVALWFVGFVFEAGGDWQLARFKAESGNKGEVLDSGLWRYTRHPNYFGDFCIWWGYFLIALSAGGWWSIVGPALMTFLLLKVSGVALLETDIAERRPKYRDYIQRTNAFFPGPPTRADRT